MRLGPGYHFSENLTDQVFFFFRGAIIKKNGKIWEKFPNVGKSEMSEFDPRGGGGQQFSKFGKNFKKKSSLFGNFS